MLNFLWHQTDLMPMDSVTCGWLLRLLPTEIVVCIDDILCGFYRKENSELVYHTVSKNVYRSADSKNLYVNNRLWLFVNDYCRVCGEKRDKIFSCTERERRADIEIDLCDCN